MFKKILAFVLTLTLVLSMAACGAPSNVRGEVSNEKTEEEFSIGSSIGNTYKNKFIGIQCSLDENWTFMSDAEILAQNQATLGMTGDNYEDFLTDSSVIYDMMANHANEMDTVSVAMEKIGVANLLVTEDQYIDAAKDSTVEALSSIGITIESAEATKIQFAGKQHSALTIAGNYLGFNVYETLVVVKCGSYIACVTVCTWQENTCMDVLNQFQAY